jgi:hypothetical protein
MACPLADAQVVALHIDAACRVGEQAPHMLLKAVGQLDTLAAALGVARKLERAKEAIEVVPCRAVRLKELICPRRDVFRLPLDAELEAYVILDLLGTALLVTGIVIADLARQARDLWWRHSEPGDGFWLVAVTPATTTVAAAPRLGGGRAACTCSVLGGDGLHLSVSQRRAKDHGRWVAKRAVKRVAERIAERVAERVAATAIFALAFAR